MQASLEAGDEVQFFYEDVRMKKEVVKKRYGKKKRRKQS